MTDHAAAIEPSFLVDTGTRQGLMAWLTTTDHKRIGLLYLDAMTCFFLVGDEHRRSSCGWCSSPRSRS